MQQLAAYLTQEPLNRDTFHLAGDVIALTPAGADSSAPLRVKKPDGQYEAARWNDETKQLEFLGAEHTGVYAVGTADRKPVGLFAVNTENYESKLTYLDDALADRPGADRRAKVETGLKESRLANRPTAAFLGDADQPMAAGGFGNPNVWVWVLLAVLIVAVAEPTLANRISALLFTKSRPAPDLTPAGRSRPTATEAALTPEVIAS